MIGVIDQFEEVAAQQSRIPKEFVESLALLDRGDLRENHILFIWLTTDRVFQLDLVNATTRNKRILASPNVEIDGPPVQDWPKIISDIPSSRQNPKILWVDDAEVVRDRIAQLRPVLRDFLA